MPEETVRCVVSLDGVTVLPDGDEEARRREASCETVSFQDADDNRLKKLSFRSEAGKATLKAQLAEEVAHVHKVRPEVGRRRCARQLDASQEVPARRTGGRLFPAPLSEVSDHAGASNWYEKCRAVLRDDVDSFDKVAPRRLRDKATAGSTFKVFERELGFFSARTGTLCATGASRLRDWVRHRRRRQQGLGQPAHEAGAQKRKSEHPRPQCIGRTVWHGAWSRERKSGAKLRLTLKIPVPEIKTGRLAKIEPYPSAPATTESSRQAKAPCSRPRCARTGRNCSSPCCRGSGMSFAACRRCRSSVCPGSFNGLKPHNVRSAELR